MDKKQSKQERAKFIQGAFHIKHDCHAYDKVNRYCKSCSELYCASGECPFYKTEQQMCETCRNAPGRQISCEECKYIRFKS